MIVTCVYVKVKTEYIERFIQATRLNHAESVKEPGNLRFDLVQQADDPSKFMIYEAYESDEAAAAHKNTAHYLTWRESVKDMMADQRYGIKYKILEPADRSKW